MTPPQSAENEPGSPVPRVSSGAVPGHVASNAASQARLPKLLVVMGSGETAPTMVKVHRQVADRVRAGMGAGDPWAVLLDTPFGFQENADDLCMKTIAYFQKSVGTRLEVAGWRSAGALSGREGTAITALIAAAPIVFAGPGSPTYALALWRPTILATLLTEKLREGGAVVFSSAAALTLGRLTVPVYEIYKVGMPPQWKDGLDVFSIGSAPVAFIPHYDNAEGGSHDTRYCYLGETRLRVLENQLPQGPGKPTCIVGIDEHTAFVADLGASSLSVIGRGAVTLRVQGRSEVLPSGSNLTLAELEAIAADLRTGTRSRVPNGPGEGPVCEAPSQTPALGLDGNPPPADSAPGALMQAVLSYKGDFDRAQADRDASRMGDIALDLTEELLAWNLDPTQTDELDRGKAILHTMVATLANLASAPSAVPDRVLDTVRPLADILLELRARARKDGDYTLSDRLRDVLDTAGVEVHDMASGESSWELRSAFDPWAEAEAPPALLFGSTGSTGAAGQ